MTFKENNWTSDAHSKQTDMKIISPDLTRLIFSQGQKPEKMQLDPKREYLRGGMPGSDRASTSSSSESESANANYLERMISNENIIHEDKIEIINQFVASRGKVAAKDLVFLLSNLNLVEASTAHHK
jgi:hypothetical protein